MRIFKSIVFAFVIAFFLQGAATAQTGSSSDESDVRKMFDELAQKDKELFDSVFVNCDLEKLGSLVTEDFEFYHDRGGNVASSGKQFVESIGEACRRRRTGADVRVKRELAENSLQVYPLNNYGAIQMGTHRFYILTDGKEQLTEIAKFTHLWKRENGVWKIARVLSFDHQPAR